jgi:DNA polymerase-3 subunit delta'
LLTFDDIFGQDFAVKTLVDAYQSDRLAHGLIFAGPVGVGKFTTAKALAGLFLCEKPKGDKPCQKCESCRAMASDAHPDFHVIVKEMIRLYDKTGKSKGTTLSINVVKPELIEKVGRKAVMGIGKVFVIEQADFMEAPAQNSMLKTLEEPPGRTLIILITDQPGALLPTIRSRCQLVRFLPLLQELVVKQLKARKVDAQIAQSAGKLADGSLGLALKWIEDGVVEASAQLLAQIDGLLAGKPATSLQEWFKKAADAYAEKQLQRDELASKDQATREGLSLYLRIASEHIRRLMPKTDEPDRLERLATAIDAFHETAMNLEANVSIPLSFQQLSVALERSLVG